MLTQLIRSHMNLTATSPKGIRFAAAGVILTFGALPVLRALPATRNQDFLLGVITGMGLTCSVMGIILIAKALRKPTP